MTDDGLREKRRKWKRYQISGGAVVVLQKPRLWGRFRPVELGPVIDMSMGGLMVQYVDDKDKQIDGCNTLSIAITKENIEIGDIQFETVLDRQVTEVAGKGKIHNLAVKFTRLTPYQKYQLEIFLDTFALRPEERRRSRSDRRNASDPRFEDPEYRRLENRRTRNDRRTG